jgi:hypothetical protein
MVPMATVTKRSFSLTGPQMAWLIVEAKRLDVTVSELLRRLLDTHPERKSHAGRNRRDKDEEIEAAGRET